MPPFQPTQPPSFTAPSVDPAITARMRPGTQIQEKDLLRRGASLSQKYQPQRTAQIGATRARLKRFGGYNVGDDGSVDRDPNAKPGQAYREAYRGEVDAANSRGMMESSFAAKAVGASWGRLSAEAQEVINQHAVGFNQILAAEGAEFDEINTGLMQLYGSEAQYMLDNPPPPPEDPVQQSGGGPGTAQAADGANILWKGSAYPNLQALQARHPGQQLGVRRTGDGKYVVVAGTGNAQRPMPTVVNGGRPTGRTGSGRGSDPRYF